MLYLMVALLQPRSYDMKTRALNRNKLHAALCIAASATVSLIIILQAIRWLFQ